jgi:hypothetical protein
MKIICAFSSDRRDLYKADIYRVLALPQGHIVHFRYKRKYIDENILSKNYEIENKPVAIFFTHGNVNDDAVELHNTSIRKAHVVHSEFSETTEVFHVYLQLDDFSNISIDSSNPHEKMPGTKFFSELTCTEHTSGQNWESRVSLVSEHFPKQTFFHLNEIAKNGSNVKVEYRDNKKSCYYHLTHGKRYILKCSLGNPNGRDSKILITDNSQVIAINSTNPIESSVDYDDFDIPISVKSLQVLEQSSALQFKPTYSTQELGEYTVNVELSLNKSRIQPIVFGALACAGIWSVILVSPSSEGSTLASCCQLIGGTLLLWFATSLSFYLFNKK